MRSKLPKVDGVWAVSRGEKLSEPLHDVSLNKVRVQAYCPTHDLQSMTMAAPSPVETNKPVWVTLWCERCYRADEVGYDGHRAKMIFALTLEVAP